MPVIQLIADFPGSPGAPGVSRTFTYAQLAVPHTITLSLSSSAGITAYEWVLVDRPAGSASVLSDPAVASPTFDPDLPGTYLVQCTVNGGTAYGRIAVAFTTQVRALRKPAAGETSEYDSARGWMAALEDLFDKFDALVGSSGIEVDDEGGLIDAAAVLLDFVGDGVTASSFGAGSVQVEIPIYDTYPATIVVGNALEGDTTYNCHYLDAGDGEALDQAINAAAMVTPPGAVYVRRGVYDFTLGDLTGHITIPAGVRVYGDGDGTIIKAHECKAAVLPPVLPPIPAVEDQTVFWLMDAAVLEDIYIIVPTPVEAQNFMWGIVTLLGSGECRRVTVECDGAWAALANPAFLNAGPISAFHINPIMNPNAICKLIDCRGKTLPQLDVLSGVPGMKTFRGIYTGSNNRSCRIDRCDMEGGDYSLDGTNRHEISRCKFTGASRDGVYWTGCMGARLVDSHIEILDATGAFKGLGGSVNQGCSIIGNYFDNPWGVATSVAIGLVSGVSNIVQGNRGYFDPFGAAGWGIAVQADAMSNYNVAVGNNFRTEGAPIGPVYDDSLGGVGNDFSHNL